MGFLKHFFIRRRLNLFKTVFVNFRVFPIKIAIRLPIFVYGQVCFEDLHKGCIKLQREPKMHSVHLGGGYYTFMFGRSSLYRSYFRFAGTLVCGDEVYLDNGSVVSICEHAVLTIGDNVRMNRNSRIHCKESISIEENCRIGWDCQIIDTDFHFTLHNNRIANYNKPVHIGHNSWLTNGVSVMKGSKLPAFSVVASKSLVNKDYSEFGEKCLFGGIPARLIGEDYRRILDKEKELKEYFSRTGVDYVDYESIKKQISIFE